MLHQRCHIQRGCSIRIVTEALSWFVAKSLTAPKLDAETLAKIQHCLQQRQSCTSAVRDITDAGWLGRGGNKNFLKHSSLSRKR
jgi:hypothetical protein